MLSYKIIPGLTPYSQGMAIMDYHVKAIQNGDSPETILFLEHDDIYTAGTSYNPEELKKPGDIEVIYTGRGGKYTYHGPGQRIIYPIMNLAGKNRKKDLRKYIKDLESIIILALSDHDITAFIKEDMIGIWTNHDGLDKKIGAIGVRVQKWVTFHGISVNISTNLDKFNGIVPCGIENFGVTSMKELGKNISMEEFDTSLMKYFEEIFG